jgi:D-alanine transfer protein
MHAQNHPWEQTPHLAPALTAVILGVVALLAFGSYARSLEHRSIVALAADEVMILRGDRVSPLKNQGTALQQAAWETDCLLPIYGSSELNLQRAYSRPLHATNLFHDYPTGFTVFPVGMAETTALINLQKLAAVGPALEGRKVVVSLSPNWFFDRVTARADGYAGNFSPLHAGELVFNTRLSLQLRQDAARRMLEYAATVAHRPLLKIALENLADGSPFSLAWYDALLPLGLLHNAILRYQDHWNVVSYLWKHPEWSRSLTSSRAGRPLDWPTLYRQAEELYPAQCNSNDLGIDNRLWKRKLRQELLRRRNTLSDEAFFRALETNQEWIDLELLLRELTEIGARPLLVSMPIHGGWYDQVGISYTARTAYYQKLRELGARYYMPVVDFADHDADRTFCQDEFGHPAPRGLLYFSQVLDGFFHDQVLPQSELPAAGPAAASGSREEKKNHGSYR